MKAGIVHRFNGPLLDTYLDSLHMVLGPRGVTSLNATELYVDITFPMSHPL